MVCPKCAGQFPDDETVWFVQGKFYCSEKCARLAAGIPSR